MESFANVLLNPSVIVGLIVGACVLLFSYILKSYKTDKLDYNVPTSKPEGRADKRKETQPQKPRKRASEHRWTGRGKQQHFSHPWHLTSFKGHTGEVLDLDFSSNGKYLASCSDDDPDGVSTEDSSGSTTSSSEGHKDNSTSASSDTSPRKGLSRRQKKNRRTVDSSPPEKPKVEIPKKKHKDKTTNNTKLHSMPILKEYEKSRLTEEKFYQLLHEFILLPEQMFTLGFPDEYKNKVRILKQSFLNSNKLYTKADQIKRTSYTDSDQTSNSSSDSLDDTESVHPSLIPMMCISQVPDDACERTCARCGTGFFITSREYLTQERCNYHWGKVRYQSENGHHQPLYTCCKQLPGANGCSVGRLHVWSGLDAGLNDSLEGFVKTKFRKGRKGSYGIFALDCEMCYTVKGLELCKVTVVGMDGRLVYHHFVKPESEVIDFNTRFSGVTESDLNHKHVKTLPEVQCDLLGFINSKTILIGHALDNDLRALKLLHSCIIDTSLSFPHERGYPFRYSLKHLVSMYLHKEIQSDSRGHDSYEDAASCMELMLFRIRSKLREMRYYGVPTFVPFP